MLLTALAIAGGPTYRASRSSVQIQWRGDTSMRDYPRSTTVLIFPGDVISVHDGSCSRSPGLLNENKILALGEFSVP